MDLFRVSASFPKDIWVCRVTLSHSRRVASGRAGHLPGHLDQSLGHGQASCYLTIVSLTLLGPLHH